MLSSLREVRIFEHLLEHIMEHILEHILADFKQIEDALTYTYATARLRSLLSSNIDNDSRYISKLDKSSSHNT